MTRPGYLSGVPQGKPKKKVNLGLGYLNPGEDWAMESRSFRNMTRQSATGMAKGKYDQAIFQLSIDGRGATGPAAKKVVQNNVEIVTKALDKLKDAGVVFVADENQSSFNVAPVSSYQGGVSKTVGYSATYSLKLVTKQIDRVSEIQDALTSISNLRVSSPMFSVSEANRQQLQQAAVASAFQTLSARFKEECRVLGLNPGSFEIDSWSTQYSGDQPDYYGTKSMMVAGAALQSRSINIESGSADISVSLSVNYRKK